MTKMTEGKKHKEKAPAEDATPHDDTVGEALRAARVAKGKTIEDVAAALRIRHTQLRAIEENNIEALPGITYAVGFVRSYANYLGLNGAETVNNFKAQHGFSPAQSKLDFPEPVAESRMPDPLIIGVGAFLAILVLAVWTFYSSMESASVHQAEQIQPAPVETATVITPSALPDATMPATTPGTPDATAATADAASAGAPASAADAATTPAATVAPAATADATQPAAPPVTATTDAAATATTATATATATAPAPTPAGAAVVPAAPQAADTVAAAEPVKAEAEEKKEEVKKKAKEEVIEVKRGKSRVTLRATQASWVQVSDKEGDVIFKKVLRPGETYMVPDQPGMSLVTSNAGGLDIVVDGQKVQAIGSQGEIVRGIELEANSLKKKRTKAY